MPICVVNFDKIHCALHNECFCDGNEDQLVILQNSIPHFDGLKSFQKWSTIKSKPWWQLSSKDINDKSKFYFRRHKSYLRLQAILTLACLIICLLRVFTIMYSTGNFWNTFLLYSRTCCWTFRSSARASPHSPTSAIVNVRFSCSITLMKKIPQKTVSKDCQASQIIIFTSGIFTRCLNERFMIFSLILPFLWQKRLA